MRDFFISYNSADKVWAEWIAWILEEAGYETYIHAWDFVPGSNFVHELDQAVRESQRTIAVLSENYLGSDYARSEWLAAFAADPTGKTRKLLPIRIQEVHLEGLLAQLIYVDVVGMDQKAARAAILGSLSSRRKPGSAPPFPGELGATSHEAKPFPVHIVEVYDHGHTKDIAGMATPGFLDSIPRVTPAADRLKLIKELYGIVPGEFNQLLFAINPPSALIPPMPAAQSDRVHALLNWAESSSGPGIGEIQKLLAAIANP